MVDGLAFCNVCRFHQNCVPSKGVLFLLPWLGSDNSYSPPLGFGILALLNFVEGRFSSFSILFGKRWFDAPERALVKLLVAKASYVSGTEVHPFQALVLLVKLCSCCTLSPIPFHPFPIVLVCFPG